MGYDIDQFFLFTDKVIVLYRLFIYSAIEFMREFLKLAIGLDIADMRREKVSKVYQDLHLFFCIKISEWFCTKFENSYAAIFPKDREDKDSIFLDFFWIDDGMIFVLERYIVYIKLV